MAAKRNLTTNGRRLAAAMLREFSEVNADEVSIEARYHPGKSQRDILTRYLRHLGVAGEKNRRYFEAGFHAVLNDFLGHALGGAGAPEPEFYEALNDAEIGRDFTAEETEGVPITRRHLTLVHSRD
jgi:hypothetical protein